MFEFTQAQSVPVPGPAKRGEGRGVIWFAALGLVSGVCLFVAVASGLGVVALVVRAVMEVGWPWMWGALAGLGALGLGALGLGAVYRWKRWTHQFVAVVSGLGLGALVLGAVMEVGWPWMWWALAGLGALGLGMLSGWGWTRRYAVREWELEDREYALKDIRREVVEERVLVELAGPSVIRFALYDLISARLNVGEKATTRESFVARVKGQGFNGDDAWKKANKVLVVWGLKKPAPGRGWAEVSEQDLRAGLVNVASLEINPNGSFAVWNGQMIRFDE